LLGFEFVARVIDLAAAAAAGEESKPSRFDVLLALVRSSSDSGLKSNSSV
jgi:hypothetical protein